jgi:hypothetical protein
LEVFYVTDEQQIGILSASESQDLSWVGWRFSDLVHPKNANIPEDAYLLEGAPQALLDGACDIRDQGRIIVLDIGRFKGTDCDNERQPLISIDREIRNPGRGEGTARRHNCENQDDHPDLG